jgi:CheY-like chemotaxis protein
VPQEELARVLGVYQAGVEGEILIIDDDFDACELVSRTAAQVGLKSRRAADGLEGLAMIMARPPAAIVLDLTLPGMDGFEVLERLRSEPELRKIPVVILSARSITVAEHEAMARAGCAYHMKGECSPREVAQSLKLAVAA